MEVTRMQFNITTDYAIRSLLCLAMRRQSVSGRELSEEMQIPHSYLLTVMGKLKKAGIVASTRGNGGGYTLTSAPEDVTLWDVVVTMEGPPQVGHCLEEGYECVCLDTKTCPIRHVHQRIRDSVESILRDVTLAQLMDGM
jgi:Rrf2 family protein